MSEITTVHYEKLTLESAGFQNPRVFVDGTLINELAESIAKHGVLYPLVVWRTVADDQKTVNVVVDGGRRLRAIQKLVAKKRAKGLEVAVPVRFVEAANLQEARVKALTGNLQRVDLSSYEIAKEMTTLKLEGMAQKDIAAQLGKSQAWVSRQLKAFTTATDSVLDAWKAGKLPDDDVQSIVKLKPEEQDKLLAEALKHRDGEGKAAKTKARKAVKDRTKKEKNGTPRVQRPAPELLKRYVEAVQPTVKQRYVRGLVDGLRLAIGEIADSELDKEWLEAAEKLYTQSDKK